MEVFDINKYKGKYVMHTVTKEQYDEFCAYLDGIGKQWAHGLTYADTTDYYDCREDTCINFNNGGYSDVEYYKDHGYTILEMEDFIMPTKKFTKADLKTGDVLMERDGTVQILIKERGLLITKNGWNNLDCIEDDLTNKHHKDFDIVAVRRPLEKCDCVFTAFNAKRGELIYERKEVEEMTLEQVCKLLGKEIKIVKG